MIRLHTLGYPRIGQNRELKFALEAHWRGDCDEKALAEVGRSLRARHWAQQAQAGLDFVTVGDFAFYDHVLDHIQLLGCVPPRFRHAGPTPLARAFAMARGTSGAHALELTKWFDTNYHYLVPEFLPDTGFRPAPEALLAQVAEARSQGHAVKVALIGPLTFLWLGKEKAPGFSRLALLERLLPAYGAILAELERAGVDWVQLDEPILGLDLDGAWRAAFEPAYHRLAGSGPRLLLATYFSPLRENLRLACQLPVAGLHVDAVRAPDELPQVLDWLPAHKLLSVGVIDGRNVWRTDPSRALARLAAVRARRSEVWLAPSCSLLHLPMSLATENALPPGLASRLSFAREKLDELALLRRALVQAPAAAPAPASPGQATPTASDAAWPAEPPPESARALPFPERRRLQQARLGLPLLPTTTIGSFPQTPELRALRAAWRRGSLALHDYEAGLRAEIAHAIAIQERLGLDVLVHGEPERTDMVEYFAELLEGFAVTTNGWVQSYGSRCVKPPILHGPLLRPRPMTVRWATYAQSLTRRPVKGMLTGPVTLLKWSFVREDQPLAVTARELALALREEVRDLEAAGIAVIQIDEPALREGLPLRRSDWPAYLGWAVSAFRLATAVARPETQIHTHMCYSEFEDILPSISAMDADVITIETSRSDMALLDAFATFHYPNDIGPGVYDVHAPQVPSVETMMALIEKAARVIPPERLWINPDCGLKTRAWPEVEAALANMVEAAHRVRARAAASASP